MTETKQLLTISSDGSMMLHAELTIADVLQLLDIAKNNILSMRLTQTASEKAPEAPPE